MRKRSAPLKAPSFRRKKAPKAFYLGCETARVGPGRTGRVPAKNGRVRVGVFELEPDPFLEGLTRP
jgi:hypothetical protein